MFVVLVFMYDMWFVLYWRNWSKTSFHNQVPYKLGKKKFYKNSILLPVVEGEGWNRIFNFDSGTIIKKCTILSRSKILKLFISINKKKPLIHNLYSVLYTPIFRVLCHKVSFSLWFRWLLVLDDLSVLCILKFGFSPCMYLGEVYWFYILILCTDGVSHSKHEMYMSGYVHIA